MRVRANESLKAEGERDRKRETKKKERREREQTRMSHIAADVRESVDRDTERKTDNSTRTKYLIINHAQRENERKREREREVVKWVYVCEKER
jgi:hypothetical protein